MRGDLRATTALHALRRSGALPAGRPACAPMWPGHGRSLTVAASSPSWNRVTASALWDRGGLDQQHSRLSTVPKPLVGSFEQRLQQGFTVAH